MPKQKQSLTVADLAQNPEAVAGALANVTALEGEKETILGQAWLAGKNELVTCGHVAEAHIKRPQNLVVKFPSSGNRYPVSSIRLHPSFVRQSDQLVKFDAAVLKLELHSPERETAPLSLSFGEPLHVGQEVYAIRYPVHLDRISAAPSPLSQRGQILGNLRQHDNFHLLHDLALAQGDSGSPIFSGSAVVAMHCGDTASLPGLNLPTTSIRLALWLDALRELSISGAIQAGTHKRPTKSWREHIPVIAAFVLSTVVTVIVLSSAMILSDANQPQWNIGAPQIAPVKLKLEKVKNADKSEALRLNLLAASDCRVYLFRSDRVTVGLASPSFVSDLKAKRELTLSVENEAGKYKELLVVVVSPHADLLREESSWQSGKEMSYDDFDKWLSAYESGHGGQVFHSRIIFN
jgi:hypothetical protein